MVAFAANSILCRAALKPHDDEQVIDPASYTAIRLAAGALVLLIIQWFRQKPTSKNPWRKKNWVAPLMLVGYAAGFSFAYIGLDTASGTLILFAFVQLTMIGLGIVRKEIPRPVEWVGLVLASLGLVYLVAPHLQTPLLKEAALMAMAGISWGVYSTIGKKSNDPISDTAYNFLMGTPLVLVSVFLFSSQLSLPTEGVVLAALSGGLASGLGYVLWYVVLPSLRSTQAAAIQLSVPIIAAWGGVLFVGDAIHSRILLAGALILIGIALTIRWKRDKT